VFHALNSTRRPGDFSLGALSIIAQKGNVGLDALVTYSRIPGDTGRQLACLEAVFNALNPDRRPDDFSLEALLPIEQKGAVGIDALLTYCRIPGDSRKRLACWEACVTAQFGEEWYSNPEWIVDDQTLSTCFANITGKESLRPEFRKGKEVGRFQNGGSVSAFYYDDAWDNQ
jgi:hypothetical protein